MCRVQTAIVADSPPYDLLAVVSTFWHPKLHCQYIQSIKKSLAWCVQAHRVVCRRFACSGLLCTAIVEKINAPPLTFTHADRQLRSEQATNAALILYGLKTSSHQVCMGANCAWDRNSHQVMHAIHANLRDHSSGPKHLWFAALASPLHRSTRMLSGEALWAM